MAMTRKNRRMALIGLGAGLMTAAAVLVSVAFQDLSPFSSPRRNWPRSLMRRSKGFALAEWWLRGAS